MKKLAIFVEGQTEQIFVERMVTEIVGTRCLQIELLSASGGGKSGARMFSQVRISPSAGDVTHFVLIVDCRSDGRVKSDIVERYDGLVASGYSQIIGIRDVYPQFNHSDIPRLRSGLSAGIKTNPINVIFTLGVMEVESWFLAEHTHFQRLNSRLTMQLIKAGLGFDPEKDDMQSRNNPASDLHDAYQLVGFAYTKRKDRVERTVDKLDYAHLYVEIRPRLPDLDNFIGAIETFLI